MVEYRPIDNQPVNISRLNARHCIFRFANPTPQPSTETRKDDGKAQGYDLPHARLSPWMPALPWK